MPLPSVFSLKDLQARIRDVLFKHDDALLRELLAKTGDDDAIHLIDGLGGHEKLRTFRMLPPARQGRLVEKLSEYSQETILHALSQGEIKAIIEAVESDEAVDIIQSLEGMKRERFLAELRKSDPKGLLPLLVFGEETAGGLMKAELIKFRSSTTVDEVRRQLAAPGRPKSHNLYVVDESDTFVGSLPPLKLLQSAADVRLADIMAPAMVMVAPTVDQEDVAGLFDEHNAIELPVVGNRGRLLGVITADDIFEVMEEEYKEDVARIAGVGEDDHLSDPVHLTIRRRLPWLCVNLGTALVAASVVGLFQDTIDRLVILVAFMPIIAGMGGNAATQTLGVVVRAIALGEHKHVSTARTVAKQLVVGGLNGLVTGLIMGGIAFAWTGHSRLAAVIVAAMTANMLIAGAGGVVVPMTLKSLRVDPALASSVFVTALTDTCGFFVFLGLASVAL